MKHARKKKVEQMTRRSIREAVIHVMAERGPDGITMARVAEQAGMGKGTLYLYYDSKDALLRETINTCFEPLTENAHAIFEADLPPDQKLVRLTEFHHQFFSENQELFRMLLIDHQAARADKKRRQNRQYQLILQKLSSLIQEGIDQQIFKDIDSMVAAVILLESNFQLTCEFLDPHSDVNFRSNDGSTILKEIFLNGILAE